MVRLVEQEFGITVADDNEADAISVAYTHWLTTRFQDAVNR